jgi:Tol biopolymer transport system component
MSFLSFRGRSLASTGAMALLALLGACSDLSQPVQPELADHTGDSLPPLQAMIFVADADGSNARPLVQGEWPAWSPDGSSIAFHRPVPGVVGEPSERGRGGLYVIDAEGASPEALPVEGIEPAWSPDGTRITFTNPEGIAVMNSDGSDVTTILSHGFREDTYKPWDMGVGMPAWSPSGDEIAVIHRGDGDLMPSQIFLLALDGSEPRRLTSTQGFQYAESNPAWSPDGSQIVLWSFGFGISTILASGEMHRSMYHAFPAVAWGAKPAWMPDGSSVAFNRGCRGGLSTECEVWATPGRVFLENARDAVWSPDGERVAFVRVVH